MNNIFTITYLCKQASNALLPPEWGKRGFYPRKKPQIELIFGHLCKRAVKS
jgi:hypothetical protein